jgi:HEPN domain-containing protein
MKSETKAWVAYAAENLASAEILLEQNLLNACLQNVQQSVEKYLKAILVEKGHLLRKTHSINELTLLCADFNLDMEIAEEDCDLLDAIYLPTKYPLGGVLPEFEPDIPLCKRCLKIAETAARRTLEILEKQ